MITLQAETKENNSFLWLNPSLISEIVWGYSRECFFVETYLQKEILTYIQMNHIKRNTYIHYFLFFYVKILKGSWLKHTISSYTLVKIMHDICRKQTYRWHIITNLSISSEKKVNDRLTFIYFLNLFSPIAENISNLTHIFISIQF